MKKIILICILMIVPMLLTGCTEELDDIEYAYPDSKAVVVDLEKYNKLSSGMTEKQVWDILGGECTNTGTTDLGMGSEYVTKSYGCNGNGGIGSNVVLMFQGGKLMTMSQIDLK